MTPPMPIPIAPPTRVSPSHTSMLGRSPGPGPAPRQPDGGTEQDHACHEDCHRRRGRHGQVPGRDLRCHLQDAEGAQHDQPGLAQLHPGSEQAATVARASA
jgi:hypothetical protein